MFFSPLDILSEAAPPVPESLGAAWAKAATWNQPVFRAPPIEVVPPVADVAELVAELPKLGHAAR